MQTADARNPVDWNSLVCSHTLTYGQKVCKQTRNSPEQARIPVKAGNVITLTKHALKSLCNEKPMRFNL